MSLSNTGILCVHLTTQDNLTFYLVSEFPPIGLCGTCFARHGRAVAAIPREGLEPMPLKLFERRKEKSWPVYKRIVERRSEDSL